MNREELEKEIDFYQEKINKCAKSKDYNKLLGLCNLKDNSINQLKELNKKENESRMNNESNKDYIIQLRKQLIESIERDINEALKDKRYDDVCDYNKEKIKIENMIDDRIYDESVAPLILQTKLSKREQLEKQLEFWDIKIKEERKTQYRRNLSSYYFTRDKLAKQLEELKKMEERKYAISINTHNHTYFENVKEPSELNVTEYLISEMFIHGWRLASWNWHVWTHDDYIYDKEGTIKHWHKTLKNDPELASVIEEAYIMDFNSVEFIQMAPLEMLLNHVKENSDNFCHEMSDTMLRVNMIDFNNKTENEKTLFKNQANAYIGRMNENVSMIELETEGKFIFILN